MTSWRNAFLRALGSGSAAAVLSGIVLAVCGKLERNAPAGPINAPSQWFWGERAAHRRRASLPQTALGYSIHHAVSIGWASLHEKHVAGLIPSRSPAARVAEGALTAAVAYFVDYHVARGRLQPGFEKHLSGKSLFATYTAFGLGLALGAWSRDPPPRRRWRH
jgi:hypothetical protein